MKIFIDIGHPAHVHYFKNLINIMIKDHNTNFTVTARDKEMTHYLLKSNNISFINRGKGKDSSLGKLLYLIKANFQLLRIALKTKPDLFLSFGSPYAAQVSFILGIPSITLDDTESAKFGQLFYKSFSKLILSPTTFSKDFGIKHKKFNGYMELSYLNPKYFEPNPSILKDLGLTKEDKYTVLRFVKWKANHDIGHKGICIESKINAVKEFSKYGKVFITSEEVLPKELEKYKIKVSSEKIHSVLYYASMFYGESATMASESSVLGTPAIYLDNNGRGYTDEQESKYGIVFNFSESLADQDESIKKGIEILNTSKNNWDIRRSKILKEKIDVTKFMIDECLKIMSKRDQK
jgi:predicted glycosyltransferase